MCVRVQKQMVGLRGSPRSLSPAHTHTHTHYISLSHTHTHTLCLLPGLNVFQISVQGTVISQTPPTTVHCGYDLPFLAIHLADTDAALATVGARTTRLLTIADMFSPSGCFVLWHRIVSSPQVHRVHVRQENSRFATMWRGLGRALVGPAGLGPCARGAPRASVARRVRSSGPPAQEQVLSGTSVAYMEAQYDVWKRDPSAVHSVRTACSRSRLLPITTSRPSPAHPYVSHVQRDG